MINYEKVKVGLTTFWFIHTHARLRPIPFLLTDIPEVATTSLCVICEYIIDNQTFQTSYSKVRYVWERNVQIGTIF